MRNLIDLTAHIHRTHSLDDKTTNLIINEKVIPQLNYAFVNKKPTTVAQFQNMTKPIPQVVGIPSTSQYGYKIFSPKPKLKIIDHDSERKLISDFLKLNNLDESKLHEVKHMVVSGKCCMCQYKTVDDLPAHLKQAHAINITDYYRNETSCILCGFKCFTRTQLIAHQLHTHKIIHFLSTNKMMAVQKDAKSLNQQNQNERKTNLKLTEIQSSKVTVDAIKKQVVGVVQDKLLANNPVSQTQHVCLASSALLPIDWTP
jgi:hypothetical protein